MLVQNYYTDCYPSTNLYGGINSVQNELSLKKYLVVFDDHKNYAGILTSGDILERPHKLIADCLIEKPRIDVNDDIVPLLKRIDIDQIIALPVFDKQEFCGIIRKVDFINALFDKIDELCSKSDISRNIMNAMLENMSHEVRTPLNSIIGFIEILSGLDENELKRNSGLYYQTILVNSEKFLETMDSIIELAMIHSGDTVKLFSEDIEIETIFPNLIDFFKKEVIHKGKRIEISHDNSKLGVNINSDKKKIVHILYHIIDNIILFEENIDISLGCKYLQETEEIEFFTSNYHGENNDNRLLPFFKALDDIDFDHKKYGPPFGVGITLVKEYTKMLRGEIYYHSDIGKNTVFLKFPHY